MTNIEKIKSMTAEEIKRGNYNFNGIGFRKEQT
jgi:hypothetical protein